MTMHVFLRTVEYPSTSQVLRATCGMSTELRWNQTVEIWHWGEDGVDLGLGKTREMFIEYQQGYDKFQDWYLDEYRNAIWS